MCLSLDRKEHLHAIDYKHGAGKVVDVVKSGTFSTEYNTQLMFYAIGMAHRYDYNFKSTRLPSFNLGRKAATVSSRCRLPIGSLRNISRCLSEVLSV